MPGTYSNILLHIVFSTKHRDPFIDGDLEPRLQEYIGGLIRGEKGVLYEIGGMPDHVHLLIRWRPDQSISDLMRRLKGNSSKWVHETFPDRRAFCWQEGYSVFTVSQKLAEAASSYIRAQKEHHKTVSFAEELLKLLRGNNVEFDERYVFD